MWASIQGLRGLTTFGLFALVALLSHLPIGPETAEGTRLRLALRTLSGTATTCRQRTAEELEALPIHMRQLEECKVFGIPYRFRVSIDGSVVVDRIERAAGVRGDRPLVLGESIVTSVGQHQILVSLTPVPAGSGDSEDFRAAVAKAPQFEFDEVTEFSAGRIVLLALDETTGVIEKR